MIVGSGGMRSWVCVHHQSTQNEIASHPFSNRSHHSSFDLVIAVKPESTVKASRASEVHTVLSSLGQAACKGSKGSSHEKPTKPLSARATG